MSLLYTVINDDHCSDNAVFFITKIDNIRHEFPILE